MDGEISPDDVKELLDDDADVRIVDIRPKPAYDRGHIPGSECIPFARLPSEVEQLDGAEHVVTVCPHGKSSVQAARLIQSYEGLAEGSRVESMAGGLSAWDYELEAEDEEEEDLGPDAPF